MMGGWRTKYLATLLALAVLLAPLPARATALTVFAAASLTDVFEELAAAFERTSGTRVVCHFAGSQVLRFQLEQGAPADVVAVADPQIMAELAERRLVTAPRTFARNRLELIAGPYADRLQHFEDLARPGTLLVIGDREVPVGRYTRQWLDHYGAADLVARLRQNVVSEEANVKSVVAKVLLGEADAGFVYVTDLTPRLLARGVRSIALPRGHDVTIAYPVAVTTASARPEAARAFVEFVLSADGTRILRAHKFLSGEEPR